MSANDITTEEVLSYEVVVKRILDGLNDRFVGIKVRMKRGRHKGNVALIKKVIVQNNGRIGFCCHEYETENNMNYWNIEDFKIMKGDES